MAYNVSIDKEKCIGCGVCAAQCTNFEMKGFKATVKKAELEKLGCSQDVAKICPVDAIKVKKK